MKNTELGKFIVENVGGSSNVSSMSHCATRLRFTLKDNAKANTKEIENNPKIISVVEKGGQYQIVIGPQVTEVYKAIENALGGIGTDIVAEDEQEKPSVIGKIFSTVSGIFSPLLPAFAGAGILRGLTLLVVQAGLLGEGTGTYTILTVAAMSLFAFLPVLLAMTSAKKFNVSPYISVIIGASLINPDFVALMGEQGNGAITSFAGIPLVLMSYSGTVIPIILSIWVYSYLERFLKRIIPEGMQLVFVPLIALLVMVPLTMIIIGPVGVYGGEMIASVINNLIQTNSLIAGAVVGGGWNILVVFGLHWAVNPIMINNVATLGYDYLVPLTFATNFAMAGATLGVFLKTKNKKIKTFSLSSLLTIAFAGITEPAIYGIAVKLKKPFIAAIIGGAVGGAFIGFNHVSSNAFVFGGLTTLPAFIDGNFVAAIIGLAICFALSAIISYMIGFNDSVDESIEDRETEEASQIQVSGEIIYSPINGQVISLSQSSNLAFASGAMGSGVAIIPKKGKVHAPVDGKIIMMFPSKHAIGMKSDDGSEVLIHVGINTVELNGEYFTSHVRVGQKIKHGDLLLEVDLEKVQEKEYDLTTTVIITNTADYEDIQLLKEGVTKVGEPIVELVEKQFVRDDV